MKSLLWAFVFSLGVTAGVWAQDAAPISTALPADLSALLEQRVHSVVTVEFFIQNEIDRQRVFAKGVVLDDEGRIALSDMAIHMAVPPERLKDFKVHLLGEDSDGYPAVYLGINFVSGTHYIQAEKAVREKFVPITSYPTAVPRIGEMLWGISAQDEDFYYKPNLYFGTLMFSHPFPLVYGFTRPEVTAIGGPVFDAKGDFVGIGGRPATESYIMYVGGKSAPISLAPRDETNAFIFAADALKYLRQIPSSPAGDPEAWLGVDGLRPLDRDVARFLKLENQGAIVLSEIIAEGPAQQAGLMNKDIIVSVDGENLPKLRPDDSLLRWFSFYLADKKPGEKMTLGIIRGEEPKQIELTVGTRPMRERNAPRVYFPRLGMTVREMTLEDAVRHRLFQSDLKGGVVNFRKANAPAATAEMEWGDWIKEIDGTPTDSYEKTVELLQAADKDLQKKEVVIMVSRGTETKVLRLKLN